MSGDEVTITIDGIPVRVPAGLNVVDAAEKAGIEIPVFCHHPYLEPVGMCRMCLVEVGEAEKDGDSGEVRRDAAGEPVVRYLPKLVAGCTTPARPGLFVRTASPEVSRQRRAILEFLLTSHPLDCPVCDKGGECPLQNLTMRYGPGRSRFVWGEKYHFPKPVPIGPLVALDRERCVLCARCIRFQDELAGQAVLAFESRGRGMEVVSFSDPPFDSPFSGNTTDICPVGALTTVDFRFEARVWEVVGRPGVCAHCAVGCNLTYDTRHGAIERVMPRRNDATNEIWLCDKGRFARHYASSPTRLQRPLVRRDGRLVEASWDEALAAAAGGLAAVRAAHGPAAVGGIAGDALPNEDLYLFGRLLRAVLGTNHVDHRPGIVRDDTVARFGPGPGTRIRELDGAAAVVVAGLDVVNEAPVLLLLLRRALARGARLVVLGGHPTELEAQATVALRYRYGAERSLLAALSEALGSKNAKLAGVAGVHPVDAATVREAASVLGDAATVLVLYGREAERAGLVPGLAELVARTGEVGAANHGLAAVGPHANGQGAADMGVLPAWLPGYKALADRAAREAIEAVWQGGVPEAPGMDAEAMLAGGVRGLFLLGTDPLGDDPVRAEALRGLDFLVVGELFPTDTAQAADVVLPLLSPAERDGTFTNLLRRVQRFEAAAVGVGEARPGWRVLRDLCVAFGSPAPFDDAADVFAEIVRAAPPYADLTWAELGRPAASEPRDIVLPFAPQTDARSVEYLGTAYENRFGEGRAWPTIAGAEEEGPLAGPDAEIAVPAEGALLLVPVTRLFDAGALAEPSRVLHPLVPPPHVWMSPFDASPRGLSDGERVTLEAPGGSVRCFLRVRDGITPGTVLAPESLRWPLPVAALLRGARLAEVTVRADEA